jgi:acetyltransferase-like isoleucine patch superfamily enzyme
VIHPSARIHPSADLEVDVEVGPESMVWHRAQIRTKARIGASCIIGRDAFIDTGVVVGDKVKVQNGALVYHGVTVDEEVFIGPGAILTNDRLPRATGRDGTLARSDDWELTPTHLGRGCSIGAGAIVVAGCDVGPFAMVGAGAVVTRAVTPHALVVGNPARPIGWVCVCGERIREADDGDGGSTCARCGRHFVFSGGRPTEASR